MFPVSYSVMQDIRDFSGVLCGKTLTGSPGSPEETQRAVNQHQLGHGQCIELLAQSAVRSTARVRAAVVQSWVAATPLFSTNTH